MKFTKIPEAHSSFRDKLVYGFDTEAAAADVELKIINADTGETIATKRLYGISQGEVDIAPWLQCWEEYGRQEEAFLRLVFTDPAGNRAYTRAYWYKELV